MTKTLLLFTDDLRTECNPALADAARDGFVALKVVDWTNGRLPGPRGASTEILCTDILRLRMTDMGGSLCVRFGSLADEAMSVFRETGCDRVVASRPRDPSVASSLVKKFTGGIRFHGPGDESTHDLSGCFRVRSTPLREIANQTGVLGSLRSPIPHPDSARVWGTVPPRRATGTTFTRREFEEPVTPFGKMVTDRARTTLEINQLPDHLREIANGVSTTGTATRADMFTFATEAPMCHPTQWSEWEAFFWEHHACPDPHLFPRLFAGDLGSSFA